MLQSSNQKWNWDQLGMLASREWERFFEVGGRECGLTRHQIQERGKTGTESDSGIPEKGRRQEDRRLDFSQ